MIVGLLHELGQTLQHSSRHKTVELVDHVVGEGDPVSPGDEDSEERIQDSKAHDHIGLELTELSPNLYGMREQQGRVIKDR